MSESFHQENTGIAHRFPLRRHVFEPLDDGRLVLLEKGDHYEIYDVGVKSYDSYRALVQSSNEPISLGREMAPLMNTEALWDYINVHGVKILEDSPVEIYVYNWITQAQGDMIFDVGVILEEDYEPDELPLTLKIKAYPAMKFASLLYIGPFPHQSNSGWQHIRWDERAAAKSLHYNEDLYRELYHKFDYDQFQHITEIQISID